MWFISKITIFLSSFRYFIIIYLCVKILWNLICKIDSIKLGWLCINNFSQIKALTKFNKLIKGMLQSFSKYLSHSHANCNSSVSLALMRLLYHFMIKLKRTNLMLKIVKLIKWLMEINVFFWNFVIMLKNTYICTSLFLISIILLR